MTRTKAENLLIYYALTTRSPNVVKQVERAIPYLREGAKTKIETLLASRDGNNPPNLAGVSCVDVAKVLSFVPPDGPDYPNAQDAVGKIERLAMEDAVSEIAEEIKLSKGSIHPMDILANVLESAESGLSKFAGSSRLVKRAIGIDTALDLYEVREGSDCGVMLGLGCIDNGMRGITPGQVMVLGGKGGVGKTAMALHMMRGLVEKDINSALLSIEMPAADVVERLVQAFGVLTHNRVSNMARYKTEDWVSIRSQISEAYSGLTIIDVDSVTPTDVKMWVRHCKRVLHAKVVFIDHMQRIRGDGSKTYERQSDVAQSLKSIAKSEDIPLVVLCQLSRKVEDKYQSVTLDSFRDSGRIEEEADYAMGMWVVRENDDEKVVVHGLKMRRASDNLKVCFKPDLKHMRFIPCFAEVSEEEKEVLQQLELEAEDGV